MKGESSQKNQGEEPPVIGGDGGGFWFPGFISSNLVTCLLILCLGGLLLGVSKVGESRFNENGKLIVVLLPLEGEAMTRQVDQWAAAVAIAKEKWSTGRVEAWNTTPGDAQTIIDRLADTEKTRSIECVIGPSTSGTVQIFEDELKSRGEDAPDLTWLIVSATKESLHKELEESDFRRNFVFATKGNPVVAERIVDVILTDRKEEARKGKPEPRVVILYDGAADALDYTEGLKDLITTGLAKSVEPPLSFPWQNFPARPVHPSIKQSSESQAKKQEFTGNSVRSTHVSPDADSSKIDVLVLVGSAHNFDFERPSLSKFNPRIVVLSDGLSVNRTVEHMRRETREATIYAVRPMSKKIASVKTSHGSDTWHWGTLAYAALNELLDPQSKVKSVNWADEDSPRILFTDQSETDVFDVVKLSGKKTSAAPIGESSR